MSLPSTRRHAKAEQSEYFFTGKACKNGMVEKRKTSNGLCVCFCCAMTLKQRAARYSEKAAAKRRETARQWYQENIERVRSNQAKKRAGNAAPLWLSEFDDLCFVEAFNVARLREQAGLGKWHVDHVIPLNSAFVCGLHVAGNIAVIPARSNVLKGAKFNG